MSQIFMLKSVEAEARVNSTDGLNFIHATFLEWPNISESQSLIWVFTPSSGITNIFNEPSVEQVARMLE